MCGFVLVVISCVWLSAHARAQSDVRSEPGLLRGASSINAEAVEMQSNEERRMLQASTTFSPAPCQSRSDYTKDQDCGAAIAGSFGNLAGLLVKGFRGGWKDGDGQEFLDGIIDVPQGFVETHFPMPVTMVSQILFPMLKSFVGIAMDPADTDTASGYVMLKHIFRRKLRSNQFRIDALIDEIEWFESLFLKNVSLMNQSDVYKEASLAHLLNLQHDLALGQELFFGAECLSLADEANFQLISAGTCQDQPNAANSIIDVPLCEQAARVLGLPDDTVHRLTNLQTSWLLPVSVCGALQQQSRQPGSGCHRCTSGALQRFSGGLGGSRAMQGLAASWHLGDGSYVCCCKSRGLARHRGQLPGTPGDLCQASRDALEQVRGRGPVELLFHRVRGAPRLPPAASGNQPVPCNQRVVLVVAGRVLVGQVHHGRP